MLYRGGETLLTRSAWIDGLGIAVKPAILFPANPASSLPMINGAVTLLVDSRKTTIGHIGEIQIPLERGRISPDDIIADFYDIAAGDIAAEMTMIS